MKRKFILILILCFIFVMPKAWAGQSTHAKGIKSFDVFKRFPVLDNGRLKPLDTYARNLLIQFSGKDTYEKKPAVEWLASVLFSPESTIEDKVFLINNPDIAEALGIEAAQHRRYSFKQLRKSLPKLDELTQAAKNINEKERSIVETEILRLTHNIMVYQDLSVAFTFVRPDEDFTIHSPELANALKLSSGPGAYSFIDIALRADQMHDIIGDISTKDKSQWTPLQTMVMGLLKHLFDWSTKQGDLSLGLIPDAQNKELWISPWGVINKDLKVEESRHLIEFLSDMAVAYQNGRQVEFDLAGRAFLDNVKSGISSNDQERLERFPLELAYHAYRPFLIAKILYILALFFFVVSFMSASRIWYPMAWAMIIGGFIPHAVALVSRIIIMARPPVSNLYETFIFVAFIAVLLGILIERVNKQWLGIVVAGVSGVVLLFIASKYSAEGDTMQMLVAVLNSNFWLGTHVVTITMGYAATCVAGILGHIWLIQAVTKKSQAVLNNTFSVLMGILGLSLTLTFLGTNLGGIWADQSWGRFWGWDPKENGALMIVLWSAMLFHARIAKMIDNTGMAVGTVIGMIVVMWAWFGVNLLSIGLHSYGFTSGIATTLLAYVIAEIVFLVICAWIIQSRK